MIEYSEKKAIGRGSECDLDKIDPLVASRLGVEIEYPSPSGANLINFAEFEMEEI